MSGPIVPKWLAVCYVAVHVILRVVSSAWFYLIALIAAAYFFHVWIHS